VVEVHDTDVSGDVWVCKRADELALAAKLVYYGAKLLQAARTLPPP
jgi:hypothetical protein